jgi:hypothetical protein
MSFAGHSLTRGVMNYLLYCIGIISIIGIHDIDDEKDIDDENDTDKLYQRGDC